MNISGVNKDVTKHFMHKISFCKIIIYSRHAKYYPILEKGVKSKLAEL